MKLLHSLTALLTFSALAPPTIQSLTTDPDRTASTCYTPVRRFLTHVTMRPRMQSLTTKTDSEASTCHVPIRRWPTRVMIQPRTHGARPDEVSLSPPALPNSPASAVNNTSKRNNSTFPSPEILPRPPTWALKVEDLVTAIYRIVSILLTLFNINITWRFHTNHGHQRHEARHAWAGVRFV